MVDHNYSITCYSKEPIVFNNVTAETSRFDCVTAAARAIFKRRSNWYCIDKLENSDIGSSCTYGDWSSFTTEFDYKVFVVENTNSETLEANINFEFYGA